MVTMGLVRGLSNRSVSLWSFDIDRKSRKGNSPPQRRAVQLFLHPHLRTLAVGLLGRLDGLARPIL